MNIDNVNSSELLHLARQYALYDQLIKQLEKDFLLANVSWDLHPNAAAPELVAYLREKLYVLVMEHFSEYLNLLYVVDVPERAFKHLTITDAVAVSDQVVLLILKREYKKVWFRNIYR